MAFACIYAISHIVLPNFIGFLKYYCMLYFLCFLVCTNVFKKNYDTFELDIDLF